MTGTGHYKHCGCTTVLSMCSHVVTLLLFPHWCLLVCPPQAYHFIHWLPLFYSCPLFPWHRSCWPSLLREDELNRFLNRCLVVPLCVTVMLKNPHFHVSNPPPWAPIQHWSHSGCTLGRYYVFLLCAALPQRTLVKSRSTVESICIKWLNLKPLEMDYWPAYGKEPYLRPKMETLN